MTSTSTGEMSGSAATSSRSSKRQSLSTIESSVTRLLVSTKHLLESLTQWAREEADDKFVSDAYVKLGNDFRAATRAFTSAGVDITDIGDVPQALRIILEAALSEAPSQENLDRFLPNIRNIIVTLLQNLKNKQIRAKSISQEKQHQRKSTEESIDQASLQLPQNSADPDRNSTQPSTQSTTAKSHTRKSSKPSIQVNDKRLDTDPSSVALAQLQKGSHIQRRASKRFSAYQYAKLTNSSSIPSRLSSSQSIRDSSFHSEEGDLPVDEVDTSVVQNKMDENGAIPIFLRINNKTKKVSIKLPASFASLRLLFVEKFAYSPGISPFPAIYIQDTQSGISYELEEHLLESEIKPGSLLSLHEVDQLSSIMKDLNSKIQALTAKFDVFSVDIASQIKDTVTSITPPPIIQAPVAQEIAKSNPVRTQAINELHSITQELRSIKQSQVKYKQSIKDTISDISKDIKLVKESGIEDSKSSHRAYMESCHVKLSEESDSLLTKVDDLQDIMEALRKDVAQRGVRVGEKQLKHTQMDIKEVKSSLTQMLDYINKEKTTWKKIWEAELDKVCEEQQFFNLQDDLTQDLEDDITKIEETFKLIEQCSVEQTKHGRRFVPQLPIPEPGESLHSMKDAVLNEVAALVPNHESRVEAIERAEKIREREREMMKLNKFQEELGEFVDEQKLKNSGGFEEIEKLRREKDIENLKSSFGII